MEQINKVILDKSFKAIELPTVNDWSTYSVINPITNVNEIGSFVSTKEYDKLTFIILQNEEFESSRANNLHNLLNLKYDKFIAKQILPTSNSTTTNYLKALHSVIINNHIPIIKEFQNMNTTILGSSLFTYLEGNNTLNDSLRWFSDVVETIDLILKYTINDIECFNHYCWKLIGIVNNYNMLYLFVEDDKVDIMLPILIPTKHINKQILIHGNIDAGVETVVTIEHFHGKFRDVIIDNNLKLGDVFVMNENKSVYCYDNIRNNEYIPNFNRHLLETNETDEVIINVIFPNEDTQIIYFKSKAVTEAIKNSEGRDVVNLSITMDTETFEFSNLVDYDSGIVLNDEYISCISEEFEDILAEDDFFYDKLNLYNINLSLLDYVSVYINEHKKPVNTFKPNVYTTTISDRKVLFKLSNNSSDCIAMITPRTIVYGNPKRIKSIFNRLVNIDNVYGFSDTNESISFNHQVDKLLDNILK